MQYEKCNSLNGNYQIESFDLLFTFEREIPKNSNFTGNLIVPIATAKKTHRKPGVGCTNIVGQNPND